MWFSRLDCELLNDFSHEYFRQRALLTSVMLLNPTDLEQMRDLLTGMRDAYARGDNAMAFARARSNHAGNQGVATLIAYDLQTGSYTAKVRADEETNRRWCEQLAGWLAPFVTPRSSLLEVGCGEATTLGGVIQALSVKPSEIYGFDISLSRCQEGKTWLEERGSSANLFVADLFNIPLEDGCVDVVYTSHSLEPNGGREEEALRELLRITRRALVLIEPLYELAGPEVQARMRSHGYVRELKVTAERLGARVTQHRLLDYIRHPHNPAGLVLIEKEPTPGPAGIAWRCPLSHVALRNQGDVFCAATTGLIYPVVRGIPLLLAEHAVVASRLCRSE